MELVDFLKQTQTDVRAEFGDRLEDPESTYPYPESVFSEIVMQHMSDVGMTHEPVICHYAAKVGNANLRLSGYAVSDDADELDLFVSLYADVDEVTSVPDSETKRAAEQCLRFLSKCAEGRLARTMDQSHDAYDLAITIEKLYGNLEQIRVFVLTDRVAKSKNFKQREVKGKTVRLEVMDIERLHRHWAEGKPRDELVIDFEDVSGRPLPCVYVPNDLDGYDYALTVIPGEALRFLYEKYGPRLLEANVRSFLSATRKVNRGIRDTLRNDPDRFMAFNNGIVIVADELKLKRTQEDGAGIIWLRGLQIVNGGQTTASIYFTKKRFPEVDLSNVRVPAKVIVLRSQEPAEEESLIADISRYANSQTAVRTSDLSANKPFHVQIEKLSSSTYCPDGVARWFYERAAGSYNVLLTREGTTPARRRRLKAAIPTSRKITKTDLAKFLNAWEQKPHVVSRGAQKNFQAFMDDLAALEDGRESFVPDVRYYKHAVAKAILFKGTRRIVRRMFSAFQGNVTTYLVSVLANRLGDRLDLDTIWQNQGLSERLQDQIRLWAPEVNRIMHETSDGRMISEWAKKEDCWNAVAGATYPSPLEDLPELR